MSNKTSILLTDHYQKDAPLYVEGDNCRGAWILIRGTVLLSMGSGRRQLAVAYAHPGAVLGLAEALRGAKYQTSAVSATDITVHFMPTGDVLQLIQDDASTCLELVEILSEDLRTLEERIRQMIPMKRHYCYRSSRRKAHRAETLISPIMM